MFGLKETIDFFGKAVRLGVLFEVVDDPEDKSDFFKYTKAIDVWLFAATERLSDEQFTLAALRRDGRCVRNITKTTPRELRQYAITTFEDGFLHVIAAPTAEWEQLYVPRVYAPIPVESGRSYNFAVSVPPKQRQTGSTTTPPPSPQNKEFDL
jgi:hypothetical protein